MSKIIVTEAFSFAHFGYQVEAFEASDEPRETTQEVADWVVEHGRGRVVEDSDAGKKPQAAPENKDAAPQRSTKPRVTKQ